MKWDAVVDAVSDVAMSDPTLAGIFGTDFRYAGTKTFAVPSLEHSLVGDSEDELWNPILIQFDIFAHDLATVIEAERRLRILFHRELPTVFGGMKMFAQFEDASMLEVPDRDGIVGRFVRFRFSPLRSLYEPASVSS